MTTTFLNPPPHLLPSSTPPLSGTPNRQNTSSTSHLLNSAAFWYLQWTKYLLNSSPLQLRCFLVPPVDKIPSQLRRSLAPPVDKIPPHFLNPVALWHPQWPPPLLCCTPSGALWRLSWQPPLLSSASLTDTNEKTILYSSSSSSFEGHPPQARHKQDWG